MKRDKQIFHGKGEDGEAGWQGRVEGGAIVSSEVTSGGTWFSYSAWKRHKPRDLGTEMNVKAVSQKDDFSFLHFPWRCS